MRRMDVAMMHKKFSSSTSHQKGFRVPKEEKRNGKGKNAISVNHRQIKEMMLWCGVIVIQ